MTIGPIEFCARRVIGDAADPLMIRYVLFRVAAFGVYVHKFCRSDYDRALHDHPWPFVALLLRGGYFEVHDQTQDRSTVRVWRKPGSVLLRPAEWRHRVELRHYWIHIDGYGDQRSSTEHHIPSWSLILVGRRVRRWGFFLKSGWCWWRQTNYRDAICEDGPIHKGGKD